MRIDLGFFSFNLSKKTGRDQKKSLLADVDFINDSHVSFIKRSSAQELQKNLEGLVVNDLIGGLELARGILKKEGIVIVPQFLSSTMVDKCAVVISSLKKQVSDFSDSETRLRETDKILFQKGSEKLSSFTELSAYSKTVVQIREGQDNGMVDVFNVNIAFPQLAGLRSRYESEIVKKILYNGSRDVEFRNLNLYLNKGITKTRGFHADSFSPQLKAFIYLTDCLTLDDGPYTYVKGSHVDSAYRRLNKELCANLPNKTETPILDRDNVVPVLGRKGTLVISDQSGFHRGFPQSPGHKRVISVMNLK
ncbi:phytanoyl-CoA dioxygenase family protein [Marinobacter sp. SBS5]|uniref:phytanoyl-CoA dioxygenase family protein n=1 Tax=Marinobacter sp. SBS5 TaxID=3401754 RepID=UPI003AAD7B24